MRKAKIIDMKHLKRSAEFDPDKTYIGIVKSERYMELINEMSYFISTLEMPLSEKERLIDKLVEYDNAVRYDAMIQTLTKQLYVETKENN